MVEFRPETPENGCNVEISVNHKMIHTGMALVRNSSTSANMQSSKIPKFAQEPLGAALRVSPYDKAAERYRQGDEFNAFVYSYDVAGDNESPLLVLTVDDPRGKGIALGGTGTFGSSTRVFKRRNMKGDGLVDDSSVERELSDVRVGDGPISATVVAVSSHSNAVFVDCGIGRKRGKKYGGGIVKVLGMLRFEDIKEASASSFAKLDLKAGDDIEVYIKAVFPQSGRFMVTLDPSIKNRKPKDIKMEKEVDKRMERLTSKVKKEDIQSLIGNEYDGIVKAKSKTGEWYYVQSCVKREDDKEKQHHFLPVGVASFPKLGEAEDSLCQNRHVSYEPGDHVRVRLEGIDEKRGQVALTLLDLAP